MRQISIDIEVTGLDAWGIDRIIEFGAVEIIDNVISPVSFHSYINPQCDSDPRALALHGLTTAFLADKPTFAEVANKIRALLSGAEIVMFGAEFDLAYLDAEFERTCEAIISPSFAKVIDIKAMATVVYPAWSKNVDLLMTQLKIKQPEPQTGTVLDDARKAALAYLAMRQH